MKIAFTYLQEEEQAAGRLIALLRAEYPGLKCKKSDRNAPFYHAYLTTKKQREASNHTEFY